MIARPTPDPPLPTVRGPDAPARPAARARAAEQAGAVVAVAGAVACGLGAVVARADAPPFLVGVLVVLAAGAAGAVARAWVRRHVEAPLARVAAALNASDVERDPAALAARAGELAERLRAGDIQRARAEKLATVGRMAAGIAHEVGNPLAAINGYAHVLRTRAAAVPGAPPVLDALERESARIDRIVRGLLDFARPRRVTPAAVGVNAVLDGAVALLRDQGVLRRVRVESAFAEPDPAVFAEPHELEQVFVNLLLNAADALQGAPGTVALITREVDVTTLGQGGGRRAGDAPDPFAPPRRNRRVTEWLSGAGVAQAPRRVVQIVVADSGPGIPPEQWERVFDPFFTTKEAGRGTGLGLAIVARTVEQLGGAVWVQRAREGGAAFVLLLPLAEPAVAGVPALAAAEGEQLELLRR